MSQETQEDVRLTLRITPELYKRIQQFAARNKPATKVNPTIVYLLETALDEAEKKPGPFKPASRRAVKQIA